MTGKIVIRSSKMALNNQRKSPPSATDGTQTTSVKTSSNVREVAGGTAANCVVVTCCCPCVLMECLILAVYKVPANICRRMWRKKRQKMLIKKRKRLLEEAKEGGCSVGPVGEVHSRKEGYVDEVSDVDWKELEMIKVSIDGRAVELDNQMWDRFSNTGFWRNPSQRLV